VTYFGDNLLKIGIKAIPEKITNEKADCIVPLTPVKEPQRYGIVELSEDGKKALWCFEKPKEPLSYLAVTGVCAFNSSVFEVYPKLKSSWRSEMEIPDAISLLISEGFKVVLHHVEDGASVVGRARIGKEPKIPSANGHLLKGEGLFVGEKATPYL
jgi:glucose-1-phosphate thymidylyltransferase